MESKAYRDLAAGDAAAEKPTNVIREFTNEEIGQTSFTFLFASQDASSSSTTWLFQVLAQRPDVLDRLREEISWRAKETGTARSSCPCTSRSLTRTPW